MDGSREKLRNRTKQERWEQRRPRMRQRGIRSIEHQRSEYKCLPSALITVCHFECLSSFCLVGLRTRHVGQYLATLKSFHVFPSFCLCSRTVPTRRLQAVQDIVKTVRFPRGITGRCY